MVWYWPCEKVMELERHLGFENKDITYFEKERHFLFHLDIGIRALSSD